MSVRIANEKSTDSFEMKHIIKVKNEYLQTYHPHLWSAFTEYKALAQRFDTLKEAEKVKKNLLDPYMWRTFEEYDIEICSGSALIIDTKLGRIDYVYTAGGVFFDGVRPLINYLQENDYEIYIASGDNKDSLVKIAECLKIPQDNVFDTQNADGKKEIVKSLQTDHDVVYMVGNHCNDYLAIKQADIGILSLEQKEKVPSKLINKADYVVDSISDVLKIVKEEEN